VSRISDNIAQIRQAARLENRLRIALLQSDRTGRASFFVPGFDPNIPDSTHASFSEQ